jgi:hypothetical protein
MVEKIYLEKDDKIYHAKTRMYNKQIRSIKCRRDIMKEAKILRSADKKIFNNQNKEVVEECLIF